MLNDLSTTVVFERPDDVALIKRWQLACEGTHTLLHRYEGWAVTLTLALEPIPIGEIAHVVVMPNVTTEKIEVFVEELMQSRAKFRKADKVPTPRNIAPWAGMPRW